MQLIEERKMEEEEYESDEEDVRMKSNNRQNEDQ